MDEPHDSAKDTQNSQDDESTRSILPDSDNVDKLASSSPLKIARRLRDMRHPQRIGHYKILEPLGDGGMGIVYLAEQTEPIHRKVAIKLIKLGMDTKQIIARFESERQALALMDHPNVAKVLDAGATEQGRPYFVMEYVPGISLTEYCDKHRLSTKERLKLFMQVCHAIQHAHQKGIIHRDIKPRNILVTVKDDKPVPKVIDFGVAKATQQKLTEKTLFTEQGQLIGTPEYMSPEQAEMTALDIDTRSDIYSLGVVLYELLIGALPFEPSSLRQAAFGEIQRIIREEEPPKPSTRLSRQSNEFDTVARKRHTSSQTLEKQIRGDLDWITMKALEKDRTRRYATATEFAADIEHHLNHEPVQASPPSASYRVLKFVRRNKGPVAAIFVIIVLLAGGVAASTTLYLQAESERQIAMVAKVEAVNQAEKANQIQLFLQSMLLSANPFGASASRPDLTIREVLDSASERIKTELSDRPGVRAAIHATIGITYLSISNFSAAKPHLEAALSTQEELYGREHPEVASCINNLGEWYDQQGLREQALPYFREALAIRRKLLGNQHPFVAESLMSLGGALAYLRDKESVELLREAVAINQKCYGDEHISVANARHDLAFALFRVTPPRYDESEALFHQVLATRKKHVGNQHPSVARTLHAFGALYVNQGRLDDAERLYTESFIMTRKTLGETHVHTLQIINELLNLVRRQGNSKKIREYEIENIRLSRVAAEQPQTGYLYFNGLAWDLLTCAEIDLRDPIEALVWAKRATEKDGGKDASSLDTLALAYQMNGEAGKAIETLKDGLTIASMNESRDRIYFETRLINILKEHHDYDTAESIIEGIKSRTVTVNDNAIKQFVHDLIEPAVELANEDIDLQFQYCMRLHDAFKAIRSEQQNDYISAVNAAANMLIRHQKFSKVEQILQASLIIQQMSPPEDSWITAVTTSILGESLVGQKRFVEAEPLLIDAYKQIHRNQQVPRNQLHDFLQRIVKLYDAWHSSEPSNGYDIKAAEWSTKLTALQDQPTSKD